MPRPMLRAGSIGRDRRRDEHLPIRGGPDVDFLPGPGDANAPRGKYKIHRLQPSETRDPQYRLKHAVDGHERVVSESQIAARNSRFGSARWWLGWLRSGGPF